MRPLRKISPAGVVTSIAPVTIDGVDDIAVDSQGVVWVAEHYGNKIAEYNPANHEMVEYDVPCCQSTSAGVYTLTLGKNSTVWFVEIFGKLVVPVQAAPVGFL